MGTQAASSTADIQMHELDEAECRQLLKGSTVGRIGARVAGEIVVYPVNFLLDESSILFRISSDSVLVDAIGTNAAFEADGIDESTHTGWSVLVQGRANDVSTALDESAEHLRTLSVSPWAPGKKSVWVAIRVTSITGRRIE